MTGTEPWPIVCGTGHRTLTEPANLAWLTARLDDCMAWLREEHGTHTIISGMARGFDLRWAGAAVRAGLTLWAFIPFLEQADRWTIAEQVEWIELVGRAERADVLFTIPADVDPRRRSGVVAGLLHQRDDVMLDTAAAVVACWESGKLDGGTHATTLKAVKRHLPGVHIDPLCRKVHGRLPGLAVLRKVALYRAGCRHAARVGAQVDLDQELAALLAAGSAGWKIRGAKPRETPVDTCPNCTPCLAP